MNSKDYEIAKLESLNHFGYLILSSVKELEIGSIVEFAIGFDRPCHIISEASKEDVDKYHQFYVDRGANMNDFRNAQFNYKVGFD